MFSKAPRFQPPPISDVPGPNAYDPTEPQAHYKQGVFPNRPLTVSRKPLSADAECNMNARRPLGPSTKGNVPTLAPTAASAKVQLKLEDKLAKAEAKVQDLHQEKVKAQNELGDLQTELRLSAQREAKLKASLEKWEKSHASMKEKGSKFADLQARLDDLTRVHEESKLKRQREIENLQEKLKREEDRRKAEVAESRKALEVERTRLEQLEVKSSKTLLQLEEMRSKGGDMEGSVKEKEKLIAKLEEEKDSLKGVLMDAQMYSRQLESSMNKEIKELKQRLEEQRRETELENEKTFHDMAKERALLQAQIQELCEDVEELESQYTHNVAMITKATTLRSTISHSEFKSKKDALSRSLHEAIYAKIESETLADERASQIQELVAVVKQVQEDRDAAKQLATFLQQDMYGLAEELRRERALFDSTLQQGSQDTSMQKDESFTRDDTTIENEQLRLDLEVAQSCRDALEEEVQEIHQRYLQTALQAKETAALLSSAQEQVSSLQLAVASKSSEIDRLIAQLGETEGLRSKLQAAQEESSAAKREAKNQAEAARSMSASLRNARVAEQAWREERDHFAVMLDEASKYEQLYKELSQQTRHLIERNTLAEEEKATLSALNSELLGHTNPNQKIMYMDRVRRELDEVKEDNIDLRIQLEQLTAAHQELEKELRSYKAVDVPLDQRPRADMTRVIRAADHETLLRTVSASLEKQPEAALVPTPAPSSSAHQVPIPPFVTDIPLSPAPIEAIAARSTTAATPSKLPKKRRSYGNISMHAPDEEGHEDAERDMPEAEESDEDTFVAERREPAVNRNRPRATLVNSGALRVPSSSSIPTFISEASSVSKPAPIAEPLREENDTITSIDARMPPKGAMRRSLGVSSLGIKARRISELVRASSPPLPAISDYSTDLPNIINSGLPSPSPHLADWTADAPTVPIPLMTGGGYGIMHSTPLLRSSPQPRLLMRKSRYSGAQRVPINSALPATKGLKSNNARTSLLIRGEDGEESTIFEDQDESFKQGWHDDLPDFSIDGIGSTALQVTAAAQKGSKKNKVKTKPAKIAKMGPMARSTFR